MLLISLINIIINIDSIDCSSDGKYLASVGKKINIWSIHDFSIKNTFGYD